MYKHMCQYAARASPHKAQMGSVIPDKRREASDNHGNEADHKEDDNYATVHQRPRDDLEGVGEDGALVRVDTRPLQLNEQSPRLARVVQAIQEQSCPARSKGGLTGYEAIWAGKGKVRERHQGQNMGGGRGVGRPGDTKLLGVASKIDTALTLLVHPHHLESRKGATH